MKKVVCVLSLLLSVNLLYSSGDFPDSNVSTLAFYITALSKKNTSSGTHMIPLQAPISQQWLDFMYHFIDENAPHKKKNYFKIDVVERIYFTPNELTQTSQTQTFKNAHSAKLFICQKLNAYKCGEIKPLVQPLVIQCTLMYNTK